MRALFVEWTSHEEAQHSKIPARSVYDLKLVDALGRLFF